MSEYEHLFGTCVTSHSWNGDRSLLAICPNDNTIRIVRAGTWEELARLDKHDQTVTAIDWAPTTGKICTASQDRNCYVWEQEGPGDGTAWKASLVLVGLGRAATCIKWSPKEDKFAVGSGVRVSTEVQIPTSVSRSSQSTLSHPWGSGLQECNISVCISNSDLGTDGAWTSSKVKKRIGSTILSVSWHPNNIMLIAGCADCTARVFNCYIKSLDGKKALGTELYGIEPVNKKLGISSKVVALLPLPLSVHTQCPRACGLAFERRRVPPVHVA